MGGFGSIYQKCNLTLKWAHLPLLGPSLNWSALLTFCPVTFCLVWILVKLRTYRQTEYDAYEPTVHTHRWAKKRGRFLAVMCESRRLGSESRYLEFESVWIRIHPFFLESEPESNCFESESRFESSWASYGRIRIQVPRIRIQLYYGQLDLNPDSKQLDSDPDSRKKGCIHIQPDSDSRYLD